MVTIHNYKIEKALHQLSLDLEAQNPNRRYGLMWAKFNVVLDQWSIFPRGSGIDTDGTVYDIFMPTAYTIKVNDDSSALSSFENINLVRFLDALEMVHQFVQNTAKTRHARLYQVQNTSYQDYPSDEVVLRWMFEYKYDTENIFIEVNVTSKEVKQIIWEEEIVKSEKGDFIVYTPKDD